MKTADRIREYFRSQVGRGCRFKDNTALARHLGLGATTATRFFNFLKGADPQYSAVVDWLERMGGQIILPDDAPDEYEYVPKVRARAGAGSSLVTDGEVICHFAFRREFLQAQHIHAADCVVMRVTGDSMEPLIKNGDTILVDQADHQPQDGRIYVLGLEDELLVKKLQRIPGGWNICSINEEYSPIRVTGGELELLRVYGRVRWFGRVLG